MRVAERDVGRAVLGDDEGLVAAGDLGGALDHHPVLGAVEVHLQAQLLARLDHDALDLETVGQRDALVEAPGPVDAAMRLGLDALLLLELLHHLLDILHAVLGRDQDRVVGLDHDVIVDADQRHQAAAGMHEIVVGVLQQHVAANAIVVGVVGRQPLQEVPRADVIPAGVERHQRQLVGLFHHRVVDRLVAAALPGFGIERDRAALALALVQRLLRAHIGLRLQAAQFGEEAARAEQEHAAVPVVIALLDELLRAIQRRLLDEALDFLRLRGAEPGTRFDLQIAVAGFRARRLDAESDDIALVGRLDRRLHRFCKRLRISDRMVGRHHEGDRVRTELLVDEMSGDRSGRGSIAAVRFEQQRGVADAGGAQLLGDHEAVLRRADHHRPDRLLDLVAAQHRVLEQAGGAQQRQELLGMLLARQRPQPRAAATGQQYRHDDAGLGHRKESRRGLHEVTSSLSMVFGAWRRAARRAAVLIADELFAPQPPRPCDQKGQRMCHRPLSF